MTLCVCWWGGFVCECVFSQTEAFGNEVVECVMSDVWTELGLFAFPKDASGTSAKRMIISVCNLFIDYLDAFVAHTLKQLKLLSDEWQSNLDKIMGLLFSFMSRSAFTSQLAFVMETNQSEIILFYFVFGFCLEETVWTWHMIFSVPFVCEFLCAVNRFTVIWGYMGRKWILESLLRRSAPVASKCPWTMNFG